MRENRSLATRCLWAVLVPTLAFHVLAHGESPAPKPNIVFILADDMGFDAVSCNNAKMGPLKTPHIDRLRAEGMNFTDAHSGSAVCTPTRYGLLTGRYCWRTPLKKEVLWDYGRPLIEKERLTLPDLLKAQGYATGMVGKWHLGLDWQDGNGKPANRDILITDAVWKKKGGSRERIKACEARIDFSKPVTGRPLDHGFDFYFGVDLPNMPPYAWIEGDRLTAQPTVPKPGKMFGSEGPMVPGWQLEDVLPTIAKRSARWIATQGKTGQPFFLYLSLTSPHTPKESDNLAAQHPEIVARLSDTLKKIQANGHSRVLLPKTPLTP